MASVKEDNKPRSDRSSDIQEGKHLLMAYKRLEEILTDKTIPFEHKIPTLVTVWQRLQELIHNSQSKSLDKIIEWAQRHTLNLVLHGDWASQTEALKTTLYVVVVDFDSALAVCEKLTTRRCKKLIEVVKDPWGDKTLCKILNDPDRCTKEEELKYFSSEHGYLVAMRLKKLCDSHCEDLALRFANACLRCLRLPESQNFLVITTEDQKRYILDIYIALLHKYKRTHDIINELKHLTLEEGLQLVHRFTNKRVELSRVWKHCSRIAELAAQFFLTAAMTKPVLEIGQVLTELLAAWISLNDKLEGLDAIPTIIRRIIQTADSAAHIYICCDVLDKKFGEKMKPFNIELYIRALTTDMNEMEKQKTHSEIGNVQETSKRLSEGFLSLADLLQDHVGVSRECVLTSFSLNPTRHCMERIEKFATSCPKSSDHSLTDQKSVDANIHTTEGVNSVVAYKISGIHEISSIVCSDISILDTGQSSTSSIDIVTAITKDRTLDKEMESKNILSGTNQVLDTETLGLSAQLCDDLAVVLSSPRYQYLSWMLEWNELKTACETYLLNAEGSRTTIKELKYLNIDYNQFKDWPSDDETKKYGGIEKGYEQWADEENSNSSAISDYPPLILYNQSNDSDCSNSTVRYRRRRKTPRRIYSSESEYESVERKVDSHGSDVDTASQDADSLGSDGLLHISKKKSKRKGTSLSHFAMIMNAHNQANTISHFNSDDVLSIFTRLDDPQKQQLTISKPSFANPPFLLPVKRSSDPQVLKSLRMYRSKKRDTDNTRTLKITNNGDMISSDSDIIKLSCLPHMNPKVLLDRYDFNSFINKQKSKPISKPKKDSLENKPIKYNHSLNKLNMIPRVVLDRYEDIQNIYKTNKHSLNKKALLSHKLRDRKRRKLDVLADIPGLNTLELIRPAIIEPSVHVVQISNNQIENQQLKTVKTQSSSSTVTSTTLSSFITSTPVTAHIQRVGQPRSLENKMSSRSPEEVETETIQGTISCSNNAQTSTSNTTTLNAITSDVPVTDFVIKTTSTTQTSQSTPTLVNILSQQIIRPAQVTTTTSRSPTLINILSQQIIRPPLSTQSTIPMICVSTSGVPSSTPTNTTSVTTTITQAQNSLKLVTTSSSQHQLIQQIFSSQNKNNNQLIKNVNLATGIANTQTTTDTSRLVQFLCKTDGKMIQLTPYSPSSNMKLQTLDPIKLVKPVTSTVSVGKLITTPSVTASPVSPPISVRSGYEENYAKFIQTSGKTLLSKNTPKETTSSSGECTSEQVNSLPKFQQAFGRTVYQNTSTTTGDQNTIAPFAGINNTSNGNLQCKIVTATQTTVTTSSANFTSANKSISHVNVTVQAKNPNTSVMPTTATVTVVPVVSATKSTAAIIPSLGMQTMQGSVIYTRQVPVSLAVSAGQTINLISTTSVAQSTVGRNQVFRITSASGDQMNLVKDTVIRSKMSALLAAALQSGVPNRSAASSIIPGITSMTTANSSSSAAESNSTFNQSQPETDIESEVCEVDSSSNDSCNTSTTSNTATAIRTTTNSACTLLTPMRITLPMMQKIPTSNGGTQSTRIVRPVLQIPSKIIRGTTSVRQQVVFASTQSVASTNARTPQTVSMSNNLIPNNSIDPLVSSTTLEQLREFDLVLEQVKERSTVQPTIDQVPIRTAQVVPTQVSTVEKQTANVLNQTSELQEGIPSVSVSYVNQGQMGQKISSCASVVVVTSYCNIQPAASPALSVTSQSSSSPCVTPAPSSSGSIGKTVLKASTKSPKSKTIKTTIHASKASPVPKPQQKPQEDEQTTQRIFDILAEYAEQLRNSPDLNNKPAPRRRSNPPTNPSQNSKRKKSAGMKKTVNNHSNMSMSSDLSPGADDPRTIGSEDSSCGVVQVSVQDSPSQGAPSTEDHQSTQGSSDFSSIRTHQTESNDTTTEVIENRIPTSGRQFIFTDSNTNQPRNVIIADASVNETLGKFSNNAAVIFPANYIAVVSGNSKILATVPARSGSNMLLFQSFVNQTRKPFSAQQNVKSIKYSTLQPIQGINSQNLTCVSAQSAAVMPSDTDKTMLTQRLTIKTSNSDNLTINESEMMTNTTCDLLMNASTSNNNISPKSTHLSNVALCNMTKEMDESANSSNILRLNNPHLGHCVKSVGTQLENNIEVLPLCSESIFRGETEEIEKPHQSSLISQNSTFTLKFASKQTPIVSVLNQSVTTRSPVIEEAVSSIQDESSQKKFNTSGLPLLDEKSQHSIIRSVIENQSASTTIDDISFTQMVSSPPVDHFSKVFTDEKKTQTNTNGPMLGQIGSRVGHDIIVESSKENVHEKEPQELEDTSSISTAYSKQKKIQGTQRTEKELQQVQQRKEAALERELHLQKSLSEECEDLGVDEPSTSDLFPEADLLFDSNNSPSFDQLSQDADKRYTSAHFQIEVSCNSNDEVFKKSSQKSHKTNSRLNDTFLTEPHGSNVTTIKKESTSTSSSVAKHLANLQRSEIIANLTQVVRKNKEPTVTLFSDEDNSNSTLRTDLLFGNLDYPSAEVEFDYDEPQKIRQMTTSSKDDITLQNNTNNYTVSSYDDHPLLTTCASIVEVCSPLHYSDSPPPIHKYKYKYCNRKKIMSVQNPAVFKSPEKTEHTSWHRNNADVIEVLSSDDDSSCSGETPERTKSPESRSGSPSPTGSSSDRKRTTSPAWNNDENAGEDADDSTSLNTFKNIYNSSKIIKLSMSQRMEPITCTNQQKSTSKMKKEITECSMDSSAANTSPPSPLSPSDSELSSFGIGRGTRRSTQRIKKNCPCCTTPDKPKKRNSGNLKKLGKGQFNKKR